MEKRVAGYGGGRSIAYLFFCPHGNLPFVVIMGRCGFV